MAKYKVVSDSVGILGPVERIVRGGLIAEVRNPVYHDRGSIIELTDDEVGNRVNRGHLAPVDSPEADQVEAAAAPAPDYAPNVPAADIPGAEVAADEPQRLTEKQQLQRDAQELGLDDSGTVAELKERISAKNAEQDEEGA